MAAAARSSVKTPSLLNLTGLLPGGAIVYAVAGAGGYVLSWWLDRGRMEWGKRTTCTECATSIWCVQPAAPSQWSLPVHSYPGPCSAGRAPLGALHPCACFPLSRVRLRPPGCSFDCNRDWHPLQRCDETEDNALAEWAAGKDFGNCPVCSLPAPAPPPPWRSGGPKKLLWRVKQGQPQCADPCTRPCDSRTVAPRSSGRPVATT